MAVWVFSPDLSQAYLSFPYMARLPGQGDQPCAPPPSTTAEGLGPLLHTWDSGAAEAGAGLTGEVGPKTCPRSHMYSLASGCLG